MRVNIHDIKQDTRYGMQSQHLDGFLMAANKENIVIGVRAVSQFAKYFINSGCPTKPFVVKNKSANLGVIAGLIPIDPIYGREATEYFDQYTHRIDDACEQDSSIKPMAITLTEDRIHELECYFGATFNVNRRDPTNYEITWNKHEEITRVYAVATNAGGYFKILDENKKPIFVLGKMIGSVLKPITSDYDLLVVSPSFAAYEPAGLDKTSFKTQGVAMLNKMAVRRTMMSGYQGLKEDPSGGNWSPRIASAVHVINCCIGQIDTVRILPELKTVHHNAEFNNPFAGEISDSLPTLFFFPKPMDISRLQPMIHDHCDDLTKVDMIMIETVSEIQMIRDFLRDEGFYWPGHANYKQEIPTFRAEATAATMLALEIKQQPRMQQRYGAFFSSTPRPDIVIPTTHWLHVLYDQTIDCINSCMTCT